ncbi:DUF3084 domain-containing protein [Leptolyngbya ohadii]|uniref:DUF3084 domain-containing protein n=1 Tax=Leptolyngbya ohadii TaxID=1962290 RepID=UPI000B59E329|nr:DUF3084 domain-containing protein [Leptolyngbya ohadii]
MTTGWVLIFAVLFLGGVIATVGDRLGMRVGKARLSLFNLRPRQTATLITILTGGLISASTLAVLLAVSDQLRTGLFELQNIQDDLATTRQDLEEANQQKEEAEDRLQQAQQRGQTARRSLEQINRSLQSSQELQRQTQFQLQQTQTQLQQIQSRFQQAQELLQSVSRQEATLRNEIGQLQSERQALRNEVGQVREQSEQEIARRDRAIAQRQAELEALEKQRTALEQDVASIEQEYDRLRSGRLALPRDGVLAEAVLPVNGSNAAIQEVDQLLSEANLVALASVLPGSNSRNQRVIQLTDIEELQRLTNQISDGREYLVQIVSAGNYIQGEPCVLAGQDCLKVYARAFVNQRVFSSSQVIASVEVVPPLSQNALIERYSQLISAVQFQASQKMPPGTLGVLANNNQETIRTFLRRVSSLQQPTVIQAIAASDIFTVEPLRLELQAVQNGQVLFSTRDSGSIAPLPPNL